MAQITHCLLFVDIFGRNFVEEQTAAEFLKTPKELHRYISSPVGIQIRNSITEPAEPGDAIGKVEKI